MSLCDLYIERYAKQQKASWRGDAGFLRQVRAVWGRRDAASITRQDAARLVFDIAARTPVTANRTRSVLLKMYTWAVDAALLDVNPMLGTKKPHREGRGKTRTLSDPEIRTLWRALDSTSLGSGTVAALKTIILLGQRPGEVSGMAVDELHDLDNPGTALWTIPAHRMKARKAHLVPLPPLAREIITTEIERRARPEFVFASKYSRRLKLSRNALSESLAGLINKLDDAAGASLKADPPTPHDLRRSVATGIVKARHFARGPARGAGPQLWRRPRNLRSLRPAAAEACRARNLGATRAKGHRWRCSMTKRKSPPPPHSARRHRRGDCFSRAPATGPDDCNVRNRDGGREQWRLRPCPFGRDRALPDQCCAGSDREGK